MFLPLSALPTSLACVLPGIAASRRITRTTAPPGVQHRDLIGRRSPPAAICRAANNEVDVRYVGEVTTTSAASPHRVRPVRPGTSAGHYEITAGTLGAFSIEGSDRPHVL